ncbi:putative uncharacterized protein DDB_G0282133 [Achroia grisella]|uniref:putative uncharacterized protein DDB_G0282133 n=1 Tax=Achroia grisella TaxID=688607 RepID=UPI0027D2A80A|nr:putative uncharacterized protein DDB_G0282133 [Achroia grisella]
MRKIRDQITEAYVTTDNNKIQDTNVTTLPTQDFDCIETTVSSNIPQLDSHIKLNLTIAINTSPKILSNRTAEDCADSVDIKTDEPLENHETGNIIKNSNLADFNIETLHENADTPLLNSDNTKKDPKQEFVKNNHLPLNQKDSDESIERNAKDTRNQFIENDDNSEIDRYKNFERRPHTIEKFKSNKKSEESEEDDTQNDDRYRKKDSYEDKSKSEESEENSQKDGRYIKKGSYEDKSKSEESEEDSQKGGRYEKKDSYEDKSKNQESNEEDSQRDGKYRTKDTYDDNSKQYNKNSYENKNEHYKGSENSNERKYFKKSNDRNENQSSHESEEQNSSRDNHSPYISGSEDSNESKKKIYPNSDKLSDTKSYLRNDDNDEKYSSRYTDETSVENSNESERKLLNPTIDYKNYDPIYVQNKSTLPIIQDVDLNDFSYERIQINNKGQIEPTKDIHEYNDDSNISKEVSQSTTFKPESLESNEKYSDTGLSSESKEENKQPIRINDGEIKPVVEITVENNSESSEAESIKDTEDKSLETFLGIKENSDHSQNEKIVTQNEKELEIGDVKQQFERIPLNYKHDENNVSENNENNLHETTTITNNEDKTQNEGTLDTLSATDPQYDKHLNFKFDEIAIKLPEIKLPDDILAYPYDESPYGIGAQNSKQKKTQENTKARFYDYDDDEDRDENVSEKKKNQDVDDYGYHGYYGKSKENDEYKKERNEEEEEDDDYVDLYEKFVRERFGKKGSFEKRSQKLKDATQIPENTKLYQTVHDVLKKTQDVQKQAERSGDPNAGYMWTLEYGQNL